VILNTTPPAEKPGLKQADLTPCAICGKGLAHDHSLNFYRVAIESHVINLPAVRRQHGLEAFLGSPALARAMGMDEDMTVPLTTTGFINICFDCAVKWHVPGLLETIDEKLAGKETTNQ
jgi:hypothetical protein